MNELKIIKERMKLTVKIALMIGFVLLIFKIAEPVFTKTKDFVLSIFNPQTSLCNPDIEFTSYTDDNFGFSIQYPNNWKILSVQPGKWLNAYDPEKPDERIEYILKLTAMSGDFSPDLASEKEVAQIIVAKNKYDSTISLNQFLQNLQKENTANNWGFSIIGNEMFTINNLPGLIYRMERPQDQWITQDLIVRKNDIEYSINGSVANESTKNACLNILNKIQLSFSLNSPNSK